MAPTASKKPSKGSSSKSSSSKSSASKPKPSSKKPQSKATKNADNGGQVKTKRSTTSGISKKKKQRTYTDKELNLPTLNMITPSGVEKPKGQKKGKVFVDDAESMRTILAMVSAEREGHIESKMQRARQMEEIREARRKEMEKREEMKKEKLEAVKAGLKKKKNKKGDEGENFEAVEEEGGKSRKGKKRVSFG